MRHVQVCSFTTSPQLTIVRPKRGKSRYSIKQFMAFYCFEAQLLQCSNDLQQTLCTCIVMVVQQIVAHWKFVLIPMPYLGTKLILYIAGFDSFRVASVQLCSSVVFMRNVLSSSTLFLYTPIIRLSTNRLMSIHITIVKKIYTFFSNIEV